MRDSDSHYLCSPNPEQRLRSVGTWSAETLGGVPAFPLAREPLCGWRKEMGNLQESSSESLLLGPISNVILYTSSHRCTSEVNSNGKSVFSE